MGCVATKNTPEEDARLKEVAAKQRRRLSVAPEKVGDTSKNQKPQAAGPENDEGGGDAVDGKEFSSQFRVAQYTKKGSVPYNRNKVNQDRLIVSYNIGDDPGVALFGVMDGHGEFGHLVADFVKTNLPKYLSAQKELRSDPKKYIAVAVKKLCNALADTGINISFSGSTAVFGVKIDDVFHIANVGDSRCVLARISNGDKIEAVALSRDQKPDVPSEKARILQAGGRVCPLPGPENEDRGPDRVWLEKVDVPGLAMSRSIGDEVSQQVGVISVPEIVEHKITRKDLFIVWASDGVWEFVSNDEAVSTIAQYLDSLPDAARALTNLSHNQWRQHEEVVDDITCVIVQFVADGQPITLPRS